MMAAIETKKILLWMVCEEVKSLNQPKYFPLDIELTFIYAKGIAHKLIWF